MATITAAQQSITDVTDRSKVWLWETLTTTDNVGSAVNVAGAVLSITLHVFGTFGSSSIAIEGTIDGTNWFTCKDVTGTAIAITSAGGVSLSDLPAKIRPKVNNGSGVDVDVLVIIR